jgi:hypothetical protein
MAHAPTLELAHEGVSDPVTRRQARLRPVPVWAAALLLGVTCFVVYNANFRTIGAGDTVASRYLPLIVWHHHTLGLDRDSRLVAHGHPLGDTRVQTTPAGDPIGYFTPRTYWVIHTRDGHLASQYPVVAPLLVAPLYLPAHLYLQSRGYTQPSVDRVAELMEKLSASLLASIAVVLMYLLLRRERIPWALPLTVAFAFGTNTWMISSQALWQHGSGELLVTLGLLLAVGRRSPWRLAALGLVSVLIAANRPPDALIAAALGVFVLWRDKRDFKWLLAGAAAPLVALLAYNVAFIGQFVGGYAGREGAGQHFFHFDPLGPAALLVSPGRGLLVFAPFLAFVLVGLRQRLKDPATRRLAIVLSAAVVAQMVVYSQADWRAGMSWGPRWLTDLLPILVWMLAPAPRVLRPAARTALAVTIVAAVAVQAIGAFWYTGTSDERIFAGAPTSTAAAWKPANTPFVVELGHKAATAELLCSGRGYFERIGDSLIHGGDAVYPLKPGAALEGWALTCGRTPAQVIALVDGVVVGATESFTPRPDVDKAMHASSPSGWHIDANTAGLTPGRHVLQLAVRIESRSDIRIVREENVSVAPPPDLRAMAARATQRLKADQSRAGYWLTTFTSSPRYQAPRKELNTYTTSVLADLLAPIAGKVGAGGAVARARRHLRAQIESNGLVRYHGLPDAPTIGTLGCVITPDADDTALAWRVAGMPAGDPRVKPMLQTLARYRDARGLYRTWLAPQARYQCIDPGRDPNPPDLVNQMHIYLMLRKLDRPAARKLCTAIRSAAGDDRVLPYYAKAPLVPYLRSAQLGQLGCPLPLPAQRLAHPAPGQEPWAELVRRLVAALGSRPDATSRRAIDALLTRLGGDDFALVRSTPPLLYHNDLTATVNRYYWSEDAGYALWLRLYEAAGAR